MFAVERDRIREILTGTRVGLESITGSLRRLNDASFWMGLDVVLQGGYDSTDVWLLVPHPY